MSFTISKHYDLFNRSQMTWRWDFNLSLTSLLKLTLTLLSKTRDLTDANPSRNILLGKLESRNPCHEGLWCEMSCSIPRPRSQRALVTARKTAAFKPERPEIKSWPGPAISPTSLNWSLSLWPLSDSVFVALKPPQGSRQSKMSLGSVDAEEAPRSRNLTSSPRFEHCPRGEEVRLVEP